ncbi:MAG TPA: SDR family NAD(P)-dependent oxidoreductase [Amycolatopsis sp.]|nr:SDR family NAD(P)-dependent oxidoreductase [Amycolatopsis sp.]
MSDQRRVLVVGGAGGIGRAVAQRFRDRGATVVATGVDENEVAACAGDPAFAGVDLRALDVTSAESVNRVVAALDPLDVVVNAAGVPAGPADFEVEGFIRSIDVNLFGTMRVCYTAQETLRRRKGCIVNVASVMSFRGSATGPAYAAGKGGVLQFTRSIAAAWAPAIRVNAIVPGFIETPMTSHLREDAARHARIVDGTPMGRWGYPDEIADGVVFLAEPAAARFVTGTTLAVDGGYLAR